MKLSTSNSVVLRNERGLKLKKKCIDIILFFFLLVFDGYDDKECTKRWVSSGISKLLLFIFIFLFLPLSLKRFINVLCKSWREISTMKTFIQERRVLFTQPHKVARYSLQ